ncbi:multiple epidermal growth factor-like domains protein 10 [Haliotis rufescens]|uniref:multiple epidermal growth factor-like domains protein 10 n=1 Tax=Haliotis rufescens TaxID=6454 RepID=UPI00201EC669|nr:multiple epidermal growth factor-like domains protein 10 [Haliotis rufescens]
MGKTAVIMTTICFIASTYACEDTRHCVDMECEYIDRHPVCSHGCKDGRSGRYCKEECINWCVACKRNAPRECTKCTSGRYGNRCEDFCGNCTGGNCSINGTCQDGCILGFWGTHCNQRCSQHCTDEGMASPCEHHTGECINGCKDGYFGESCDAMCPDDCEGCNSTSRDCKICNDGFYGIECYHPCPQNCKQCLDSNTTCKTCSDEDGMCSRGCTHGFYGPTCNQTCPQNCKQCLDSNTTCKTCSDEDGMCSRGCTHGFYGPTCNQTCPQNCKQCLDSNTTCKTCSDEDGMCSRGCTHGFYGPTCNQTCPQNCKQCLDSNTTCKTCSDEDGMCSRGCTYGFYGPTCNQTCPQNCKDCNESGCQQPCPENCLQCNMTGNCDDCMIFLRSSNCALICQTCPSVRPYINCTVECKDGIDGARRDITTQLTRTKDNEDFFGKLSELIKEKEYLLPFLASALVLCIGLLAFILWKYKKTRRERLSAANNGCLASEEEVFQKCGDIYHEIHDEDLDTNMSFIPAGQRPLPDRPRLPIPLEAVTSAVDHACSLTETGASGHSSVGYLTPQQTQDVEQPRYTSSRTDDGVYLDARQSNNTECVGETSFTVTPEEAGKRHLLQGHSSAGRTISHVTMSANAEALMRDIRTRKCGKKHLSCGSRTHLGYCFVSNDAPQTTNEDKADKNLFNVRVPVCEKTVFNPNGSCGF